MLSREVIQRSHGRALLRMALFSVIAGALVGPMFIVGVRMATAPLAQVIVVRRDSPPAPPPPECAAASVRSTVARAAADAWLADAAGLARSARIVPSLVNGQPHGFKLYAIRSGSPLAAVGLVNGDTVTHIDGVELTSLDRALAVAAGWQTSGPRTAVVDLVRRGCPVTLTVTVV